MGLYNTIRTTHSCDHCTWSGELEAQFKYGNLHNHDYKIGDKLIWGRTQIGDPAERFVATEGLAICPKCGEEQYFDILIVGGQLRQVSPSTGLYDYHHGEGEYVILSATHLTEQEKQR